MVKHTQSVDSTIHYQHKSLDSLQQNFRHRTDSLKDAYASPLKGLQTDISKLHHKKDSLTKLNLPTTDVSRDIDSLQKEHAQKLSELNSRADKLKQETLSKASQLNLPPEAQKELSVFSKNIHGFSMPNTSMQLPGVNMPNLNTGNLNLPNAPNLPQGNPSLPNSSASAPQLGGVGNEVNGVTKEINSVSKEVNGVGKEINSVSKEANSVGKEINSVSKEVKDVKNLDKNVDAKSFEKEGEKIAQQNQELKSVMKEEGSVKNMQKELDQVKNTKKADSLAMQQLKPAVNHFAGKEAELKTAMDKVSKLKQKYSSVKSLAELPKRAPNPLRDKPWIERIVPGLNYFIQNKHYAMVDFNPYIGWRFNPRFTAYIGWNQRIGISHWNFSTDKYDRVFGLRTSAQYLWTRGIVFKIAPEIMNGYVPTNAAPDTKHREWVWSLYAGVRKDFSIYKGLKGYSEVMYNFAQKSYRNLYGDPVSFRFGLEMQLKKKVKNKEATSDQKK